MFRNDMSAGVLRPVAALYMFGYVGMSLVYLFFLFMPGTIGNTQR